MSARFHALSVSEFAELVARFSFTRRIETVHLHHTWKPTHADYDGLRTIEAMWRHHTQTNGWSDIAQHVTIAPDGTIWTGRPWNLPPCSAAGHNGNRVAGPFMIEMIGDFDGSDRLEDPQRDATLEVIARVQRRNGLPPQAVRGHNEMSPTTCPGARVDRAEMVARLAETHNAIAEAEAMRTAEAPQPFGDNVRAFHAALADLQPRALPPRDDPATAELTENRFAFGSPSPQRALCVGVNTYPTAPLHGCVADARLWKKSLESLGFSVDLLTDRNATRATILDRLAALVRDARAGDVLVFQFSGHGTQVPDVSADESDRKDEALCPVDFASGRLIIDDDLAPIMQSLGRDVNLTCFIDCCHSGTISRLAVSATARSRGPDERPRFVEASADLVARHRAFRAGRLAARATRRPALREVVFAACQPWEVAWESRGQGDFTRLAAPRLRDAAGQVTNAAFHAEVISAFGEYPRQRPLLTCATSARRKTLLASRLVTA